MDGTYGKTVTNRIFWCLVPRYEPRKTWGGYFFRSILLDTDSYLLQMVRYIHRNPLRAGLVKNLDVYKWSSHKVYLSITGKWDWLHKNYILSLLSKNRKDWLRSYRRWVAMAEEDEVGKKISGVKWPVCLGPQEFIDRIKETAVGYIQGDRWSVWNW